MMFDFSELVRRYSRGTVVAEVEQDGYYDMDDGGRYVEGRSLQLRLEPAAIVPLSNEDLRHDEGGLFNQDSRKLYCYYHLDKGTSIVNRMEDGCVKAYTITGERDYSDYDPNLHIYFMERANRNDQDA